MERIEVSDEEAALLRSLAAARGMTVSELLRKWLRDNGFPPPEDGAPST